VDGVKQDNVNEVGDGVTDVGTFVSESTKTVCVPTQPLPVLVVTTVYTPPTLEVTVDNVFVPTIPGPDQL
jgi:hypothetical protein